LVVDEGAGVNVVVCNVVRDRKHRAPSVWLPKVLEPNV
jgi:hypothetical protein